MPDFLKAFIASATPPEGYGNANFVLNWTILLMFAPYVTYALAYSGIPYKDWILLIYSLAMALMYSMVIAAFKREMVYVSNPFDFVKVNFIHLVSVVAFLELHITIYPLFIPMSSHKG